jgi:hypothetical protein
MPWLGSAREAQKDEEPARKNLNALPTVTSKAEPPRDARQIPRSVRTLVILGLGDFAQRVYTADAAIPA